MSKIFRVNPLARKEFQGFVEGKRSSVLELLEKFRKIPQNARAKNTNRWKFHARNGAGERKNEHTDPVINVNYFLFSPTTEENFQTVINLSEKEHGLAKALELWKNIVSGQNKPPYQGRN
jgi:hypothetical protein